MRRLTALTVVVVMGLFAGLLVMGATVGCEPEPEFTPPPAEQPPEVDPWEPEPEPEPEPQEFEPQPEPQEEELPLPWEE